ncbi:MAG: hypothetical protein IPG63_05120 [Xanthomonadales bacterium]|jgi:hypothetical protein|nr:hypothetical protein [Xanthomonadales bacterium]
MHSPKLRLITCGLLGVLTGTAVLGRAHAGGVENDCADPYWASSLRCAAHPLELPQPPPASPTLPTQLREFTRVTLNGDLAVRCLDGTRPVIYVDPAEGGPSSRWLISVTGGGACSAEDLDQNGSFENADACAALYAEPGEADEMGTADEPAMKTLGSVGTSEGLLKPDLQRNPVFARFHRVRIEKCSYDRFNGRSTHEVSAIVPGSGGSVSFSLFQHGQKIMRLALEALRGSGAGAPGIAYSSYVADGIGGVVPQAVQLPSIADATQVVFVGHSGGAHGLYHNIDRLSDALAAVAGFHGDVRVIHDANFLPTAENEAAFDPDSPAGLFAQQFAGSSAQLGSYDGSEFIRLPSADNRWYFEQYRAWFESEGAALSTIFDTSCAAAHAGSGDQWKCRDRLHVRLHHETTPALLREDFLDPNAEHTQNGFGHALPWGPYGTYGHCTVFGFSPCPPLLPVGPGSAHEARLLTQAQGFMSGFATQSELATGADASGPVPSAFLWMPECGTHEGTYDDEAFYDIRQFVGARGMSLRELAEAFVAAPRTGRHEAWVDGLNGAVSECGPRLLTDSFEQ